MNSGSRPDGRSWNDGALYALLPLPFVARMARQTFSRVAGISIVGRADPCQRIVDRVHHRRDRAERAGLADAFDPERVAVGRRLVVAEVEIAEIGGARHAVIHERAGQELAALVVDDVLHQHLADPLDDAAMDLPFASSGLSTMPTIVDRGIAGQLDLAGLCVDLDLAEMRARWEGRRTIGGQNWPAR